MRRVAVLVVAVFLPALVGCSAFIRSSGQFDGARAYGDVTAQCALGPRVPASTGIAGAREYIAGELTKAGWTVERDNWTFRGVPMENVVASRGEGPLVIVGAHYDSRAVADRDEQDRSLPVPGANDGASGVAVLLELARTLDASRLHNEVRLAFFDGEDQGTLQGWPWSVGARHMAESLDKPPQYVIVVDMVGDAQQDLYWERSSTPWLNEQIWALAGTLGYSACFVPTYKHSIIDDHTPFLERGIPAVDIIDFDYPYWHTTADTPDKVSAASLERVGRVLEKLLEGPPPSAPGNQ